MDWLVNTPFRVKERGFLLHKGGCMKWKKRIFTNAGKIYYHNKQYASGAFAGKVCPGRYWRSHANPHTRIDAQRYSPSIRDTQFIWIPTTESL